MIFDEFEKPARRRPSGRIGPGRPPRGWSANTSRSRPNQHNHRGSRAAVGWSIARGNDRRLAARATCTLLEYVIFVTYSCLGQVVTLRLRPGRSFALCRVGGLAERSYRSPGPRSCRGHPPRAWLGLGFSILALSAGALASGLDGLLGALVCLVEVEALVDATGGLLLDPDTSDSRLFQLATMTLRSATDLSPLEPWDW